MGVGNVSNAVVVSGGNRTRLIVNMNALSPYVTRQEGNDVVLRKWAVRRLKASPK